ATSHQRPEYIAVNAGINAATTANAMLAVDSIGARIVGIANSRLPHDPATPICGHTSARVLGSIATAGADADWFLLQGATSGQSVTVETFALRSGANLDTMIAVYNATTQLGINDDIDFA